MFSAAKNPIWHHSSASTLSGVAKPPGPRNLSKLSRLVASITFDSSFGARCHALISMWSGAMGSKYLTVMAMMSLIARLR